MMNRGRTVGAGLELEDPVQAMRQFSRDPWLHARAPLKDGRKLTALEVQESYLGECERAAQVGGLPEWAPEALRHWRETLEGLAKDPLRLAGRLDPYCKLLIYEHELLRADCDWADLRQALGKLTRLRANYSPPVVAALLAECTEGLSAEALAEHGRAVAAGVAEPKQLERLRFAVRLQALDVQYHQLGGLYDRLCEAGRVDRFLRVEEVERATREAPPGGRAAARAAGVVQAQGEPDWRGDWQYLWHEPSGRCLDLRDPFSGEVRMVHLTVPKPAEDEDEDETIPIDVLDLLETADQAAESAA
jgi:hypothetical protein